MLLSSEGLQHELSSWNRSRRAISRASRLHGQCRGMHNNVPRRSRVSRPSAHPRRRCSPVSRESNGRPLVKMLLFAYASRGSPRGPRSLLSSPLRSTPMTFVWGRNEERLLRDIHFYKAFKAKLLLFFWFTLFYLSFAIRQILQSAYFWWSVNDNGDKKIDLDSEYLM